MTYGGVQDKYIEFFAGHLDTLDRAYNKPTTDQLLEIYLRGEPYLRIYDESAEEIAKTKEEIKDTRDHVRDIQIENLMTKSKLDEMERKNADLAKRLNEIGSQKQREEDVVACVMAELKKRGIE